MKTHQAWILVLTSTLALGVGQAVAQSPTPLATPVFASFYSDDSIIQQVSHSSCDAGGCSPAGCNGCGNTACAGGCGGTGIGGFNLFGHGGGDGYGSMHFGQESGPLGGGGCCAPIWHDFHIEWMNLFRDDAGQRVDLTSRGAGGPIVLSTDDLDMEFADGFRATYSFLVGPSTGLELGYFGTHEWNSTASVTGASDLFTVFSNFGTVFIGPVQGFPQTADAAVFHGIDYSSELHNAELNLRRRWVSANCLLHGSYLAGLRYTRLNEYFSHNTRVADGGFLDFDLATQNDAIGAQIGTDLFVCVSPRFKVGAEIEGGVYGNNARSLANVRTLEVDDVNPAIQTAAHPINNEALSESDVAFIGEASAIAMFRVTPRLTIRGGYTVMFMDGMALASENLNVNQSPFGNVNRSPNLSTNGEVFYHGANAGITWTW